MKRGQVTIYIIVGIVIIAIIALFVVLFRTGIMPSPFSPSSEQNPNSYLRDCLQEDVNSVIRIMEPQGGTMEPTLYKRFMFVEEGVAYNVSYLCYTSNDYIPCVNQNPALISSMEKEIKAEIEDKVNDCFEDLKANYKSAGYDVSVSGSDYDVKLQEGSLVIGLDRTIKLSKGDQSSVLNDFRVIVPTKLYDVSLVAMDITNKEATKCRFDQVEYNLLDPETVVEKYLDSDNTKIYTVKLREGKEFFRFAIKGGCSDE